MVCDGIGEQISILPPAYRTASILYLSHNSISSLMGLRQFKQAQVLSLSDNKVCSCVCCVCRVPRLCFQPRAVELM